MSEAPNRSADLKVGLFVAAGVAVLIFVVFLIGQERHLFERPVFLKAEFPNVAGLKVGAAVRLSGVDVGIVSGIDFPPADPKSDERVVAPTTLADIAAIAPTSQSGGPAYRALPIALEDTTLPLPRRFLVTARCRSDDKGGDACQGASRRITVDFIGKDQFGDPLKESVTMAWTAAGNTVEGAVAFKVIDEVRVYEVRGETVAGETGSRRNVHDTVRMGFAGAPLITVTLRIRSEALGRIRDGSQAELASMGLLGDKTIDIGLGPSTGRQHQSGDALPARMSGLDELTARIPELLELFEQIKGGVTDVSETISGFTEAGGKDVVLQAVRTVEDIALQVKEGRGLIHELVWDDETGKRYGTIVRDLESAIADANGMIHQAKTGDGLVHGLLYSEDGEDAVKTARDTLAQVRQILLDVQQKEGIAHQLIYDEDNGEMVTNLSSASADVKVATKDLKEAAADIKVMVADAKKGKGTVGALLTDPSVYEDLKVLLGNVKRNDAVKALVRYSIERDPPQVSK